MSASGPLVLLVEDEAQMRRFLRASLSAHGYRLVETTSGAEALQQATAHNPDVVLLDLGLPDMDGITVTKRLREWTTAPVIVISARDREQDKIDALDGGADDYLTKPFGTGELLARLRVALRHAERAGGGTPEPTIVVGELEIDLARRHVKRAAQEIHLTPIEYKLFATLMKHAGKVLTHRWLLGEVWGPRYADQTQYLRVYMAQLRHKLEADPARPRYLMTEPGVGYRLRSDSP
jgi:two-component system, OmpR family, KDP operon response regulator KdpE